MSEAIVSLVGSALISLPALILSIISFNSTRDRYKKERAEKIRLEVKADLETAKAKEDRALLTKEVLNWSNLCIRQTTALHLIFVIKPKDYEMRFTDIAFQTSALIGVGRLFFRNTVNNFRPIILDQLMIAHRIACMSAKVESADWKVLQYVTDKANRRFIEFVQAEVGRKEFFSKEAARAGDEIYIDELMENVTESELQDYLGKLGT